MQICRKSFNFVNPAQPQQAPRKSRRNRLIQKELFETIVCQGSMPIVVIQNGEIAFCNPACCAFLGFDSSKIIGTQLLKYIHPDDSREVEKLLAGTTATPDFRVMPANGSIKWVRAMMAKVNLNGDTILVCYLTDITNLAEKILSGLLPICSCCKKIRNEGEKWVEIESYLTEHTDAEFSHGICPKCQAKEYPSPIVITDDEEFRNKLEPIQVRETTILWHFFSNAITGNSVKTFETMADLNLELKVSTTFFLIDLNFRFKTSETEIIEFIRKADPNLPIVLAGPNSAEEMDIVLKCFKINHYIQKSSSQSDICETLRRAIDEKVSKL